ncbi:DUF4019 domain-containing protein [uncultured Vibrio sp.]|mgnify:CR=1 FL=1|uniref:DUF4019 domain-containing protein n=1 Tax=uncultured Vibrio sp. TaxID=114054 RepID=UPI0025DAF87F|nr:DUF4019 domain-containing protein [uncultured Vibrio sp.]
MLKKLILVVLFIFPITALSQPNTYKQAAQSWLTLVDTQDFKKSWDASGTFFRSNISKTDWVAAISNARNSVGQFQSRQLLIEKPMSSLPNAPDGDYMVLQYQSTFAKSHSVETITLSDDNGWRVVGYFIK